MATTLLSRRNPPAFSCRMFVVGGGGAAPTLLMTPEATLALDCLRLLDIAKTSRMATIIRMRADIIATTPLPCWRKTTVTISPMKIVMVM